MSMMKANERIKEFEKLVERKGINGRNAEEKKMNFLNVVKDAGFLSDMTKTFVEYVLDTFEQDADITWYYDELEPLYKATGDNKKKPNEIKEVIARYFGLTNLIPSKETGKKRSVREERYKAIHGYYPGENKEAA